MAVLIIVVFVTLFVSANCSLYEAVLYSTRMATLESVKARGKPMKLAALFISMKKNIAKPIAAILILNTLANTAGATISGMYATKALGAAHVPLFSLLFTLGILFISEIMPKTIGAMHWRKLWPIIVFPLEFMIIILRPVIFITQKFSDLFFTGHKGATITEEEILATIHMGAKEGEISQDESRMVRNIIDLENKAVREIMTPRTVVFSLDGGLTLEQALCAMEGKGFTRIPVYEGDRENIIGYIMLHDLTSLRGERAPSTLLRSIVRQVAFIPENANCLLVLLSFLKNRRHLAIVSDEFGGVAGLVSLEDLLETILGTEIVDETDRIIDLQKDARKRRLKSKENDEDFEG